MTSAFDSQSAPGFDAADSSRGAAAATGRLLDGQIALNDQLKLSAQLSKGFATSLGTAFEGLVFKGRSLGDTFRSLVLSLSQLTLAAAFKPMQDGFGSLFQGLLTGSVGGLQMGGGSAPIPFAKGGVIATPVSFPLGSGSGIAGERGAEAIMPLARGPDGRLGVAASGAGSGVHVTFNVAATDVESFRRSETQLAALLARAVGHGQRNL